MAVIKVNDHKIGHLHEKLQDIMTMLDSALYTGSRRQIQEARGKLIEANSYLRQITSTPNGGDAA